MTGDVVCDYCGWSWTNVPLPAFATPDQHITAPYGLYHYDAQTMRLGLYHCTNLRIVRVRPFPVNAHAPWRES